MTKQPLVGSLLKFLERHWPPILITLLVLGLNVDMALGSIPATGDHMIHMYKGWHMAEHMIPSGRLTGWSNMAFAGYPSGVYYPTLGDLFISAFRYITFGLLSWERTYVIAFLFLLVAMPLSVYVITRRAAGQTGALVAAVLSMGDVGGWPEGGHFSTVLWAVWPFMLGLTLSMFSVVGCEEFLKSTIRKSPLRFLGFSTLLAISVLAHPMNVFFLGIACPAFVLFYSIAKYKEISPFLVLGRAALAAIAALLMTLFWTWPYLVSGSDWTHSWPSVGFGGLWYSLEEMLEKLLENELFKNFYWVTCILGLIGVVLGIISRRFWPTFLSLLLIIAFIVTGLCYELGPGFIGTHVQIERMAAFMKFIWFALAGLTIDRVGYWLLWLAKRLPEKLRLSKWWQTGLIYTRRFSGVILVIVLVVVGWKDSYGKVAEIGRLGGEIWDNIVKAETWLGQQPIKQPLERVLYQPGKMCIKGHIISFACDEIYHRHIFASGPIRTKRPKLRFGYEATAIFRNTVLRHRWPADAWLIRRMMLEPEAFDRLHVRWIISVVPWPERSDVKEVKRFGDVGVYSVEAGKGQPVQLKGKGKLKVEHFSDEKITVRITDADPGARLLYPIAYYYPWHAYHNGRPIDISVHGVLPKVNRILMNVPAYNGVTELKYERFWHEHISNWISLLAWIAVLGGVAFFIVRRRRAR